MNINLGNYPVYLQIVYKNNQNIYLRFNKEGFLVATVPKRTSTDEVLHLIKKSEASLIKMYEKNLDRQKESQEFWLLGQKYIVSLDDSMDEVQINGEYIYAKDQKALDDFISSEMKRVFQEEIDICKNCFNNLPEFTLKIRSMRTRWGVCNRLRKTITLNSELIRKPIDQLDYVIIHEMAHFYEGNHSKKFWKIVSDACPRYKELRKALKK